MASQPYRSGAEYCRGNNGGGEWRPFEENYGGCEGEILELKKTINTMVDQLNSFASEVTRVALEVGTEGKLGGQAKVKGVGGTWKDLNGLCKPDGS